MRPEFAALSRDPIRVTLCGQDFFLPWRPAAVWVQHLDRAGALAALLADEADRDLMAEAVTGTPGGAGELSAESLRILAQQTGRRWWEGSRLLATSVAPEALGRLTLAGVDPWKVSVGQWCAATYSLCTKNADDKGKLRFDFSLSIPPEGFEDEWDDGADDAEQVAASVAKMGR